MFSKKEIYSKIKEFRLSFYLFNRNLLSRIALVILLLFVLTAIFAPVLSPYPEDAANETHMDQILEAPSMEHLFGTDELGRDVLSRVLFGTRISLVAALETVLVAMILGSILGALAGTIGGAVDEIIMRITDVFLSFPSLLLAIAVTSLLGASLGNAQIAMVISWWPWYTRIMRGQAILMREHQFVKSAEAIGTKPIRIIFKHIVPNCLAPIIIQASMDLGAVVMTLASLSYLGLGAQPPLPEWGLMVNTSKNFIMEAWWYTLFPAFAIFLIVTVFNLIGDGLREVLDPKTRKI